LIPYLKSEIQFIYFLFLHSWHRSKLVLFALKIFQSSSAISEIAGILYFCILYPWQPQADNLFYFMACAMCCAITIDTICPAAKSSIM